LRAGKARYGTSTSVVTLLAGIEYWNAFGCAMLIGVCATGAPAGLALVTV
jgi:hypothetical protein